MKRGIWLSNAGLFRFRGRNGIVPALRCQPKNCINPNGVSWPLRSNLCKGRVLSMYGVISKIVAAIFIIAFSSLSYAETVGSDETAATAAEFPATAHATVELVSQQLIGMLGNARERFEENPEEFYADVDSVISPWLDFERWSKSVMGKEYSAKASEDQLQAFESVFRKTLIETYAKGLISVDEANYEVAAPKPGDEDKDRVVVSQTLFAGSDKVSVRYAMYKSEDRWRVLEVSLEGVALRQTFQSQFKNAAIDKKGDLDQVIQNWGA